MVVVVLVVGSAAVDWGLTLVRLRGGEGAADESRRAAATMRAETFAELKYIEVDCSQFFSILCIRNLSNKTDKTQYYQYVTLKGKSYIILPGPDFQMLTLLLDFVLCAFVTQPV